VGARFSAAVQTGPGAHPASCTMGTGYFLGLKRGRGVTLKTHSLLVPWSKKSRALPLLPLWAVRPVQSLSACTRVHFTFFFTYLPTYLGTAVAQWLRCCATNRKVAGSIPSCVSGFFIDIKSFRLPTYLTQWSRIHPKKITGPQLIRKIPHILWNPRVHYRIHKRPTPVLILSHSNQIHPSTSYFLNFQFNIILPSTSRTSKWSISLTSSQQNPLRTSPLHHKCYMPRRSHSRFDGPNEVG